MFHNNYKIYPINFNLYSVEIEYWNEYTNEVNYTSIDLDKEQMNKLVDLLTGLDFDDHTPGDDE